MLITIKTRFSAERNNMKVEFFEKFKGQELTDEIIKQIQAESGKDVTAAKEATKAQLESLNTQITELQTQVSQRDTDLAGLKTQLETAGQSSAKLTEVQNSFAQLQEKYNNESQQWKEKLEAQAYEFAVQEAVADVKFSCSSAKKQFISDLKENKLPLQDGKLLGFSDYLQKQKEADASNFAVETPPTPPTTPQFIPPVTPQQNPKQDDKNEFGWNFMGVRQRKEN